MLFLVHSKSVTVIPYSAARDFSAIQPRDTRPLCSLDECGGTCWTAWLLRRCPIGRMEASLALFLLDTLSDVEFPANAFQMDGTVASVLCAVERFASFLP